MGVTDTRWMAEIPEVLIGRTSTFAPRARRRPWGGLWEGVVHVQRQDGAREIVVCDDGPRESESDALVDAAVEAMAMWSKDT